MRSSTEPMDKIYIKGYEFLSFAKNMGTHLSNKYGQKLLDNAKIFTTDAIKTSSKRAIQKTAEATGDLIGNTSASKSSKELHSAKLRSKHSKNDDANNEIEVPKERYISLERDNKLLMN